MKHLDEFRYPATSAGIAESIARRSTREWRIMEVCGGQTHSIVRFGIDSMLSKAVTFLHGPGCPVCVTPAEQIDQAIELALTEDVILCSFGDMIRVRGTSIDLMTAKARGADVRVVYSPLESLKLAVELPERHVVFFGIGFETTAPLIAATLLQAMTRRLSNFSVLSALRLIPPAIESVLASDDCRIDALLAPGHVCTITGLGPYREIASRFSVPVVVTGFEPVDILAGADAAVRLLESGRADTVNAYPRSVRDDGNTHAQELMNRVLEFADAKWRGMGRLRMSGLHIRQEFADFDAARRFDLVSVHETDSGPSECIDVLMGRKTPAECSCYGSSCNPDHPIGPLMVSSEGACAAYHRYRSQVH